MSGKEFGISRQIGIDAGHRIPNHHSKCSSVHGHRYLIEIKCVGLLEDVGSTEGMVGGLDFSFIKEEMMEEIDTPCDHGLILFQDDPLLASIFDPTDCQYLSQKVGAYGYLEVYKAPAGKLYIVPFIPTAENLAKHWYERLLSRIESRSEGRARLRLVTVWETPNCKASYPEE